SSSDHPPIDGTISDTPSSDTSAGAFALTSTAFAASATVPTDNTCNGADSSPPLAWTGAPSMAQSFALVLTDQSLQPPKLHWVIYDIPVATTSLPASVENVYAPASVPGAHQTMSEAGKTVGYAGPCPQPPPTTHMYQFALYALDVTPLPGGAAQTTAAEALASIETHKLANTTLIGIATKP
ncbi:MAG TPA: YbhB/YbcL family Raf kinase inhibitor-like protein, partial [Kofleriaceae bacterium]|nr:YbhB/YbcL family Raf kinase inhibitor-like protein [Kofleriaceae bacterium]